MKKYQKFTAALAALFILSNCFPVSATESEAFSGNKPAASDSSLLSNESITTPDNDLLSDEAIITPDGNLLSDEAIITPDGDLLSDEAIITPDGDLLSDKITNEAPSQEFIDTEAENSAPLSGNALVAEMSTIESEAPDMPLQNEAPMFRANIEYSWQGYVVKGTFTEFPDDISHIRTLYSLDGETYQECSEEWDLHLLGTKVPSELAKLQTQICLYDNFEPLKSYLSETINRFYLKLRLTLKDGKTYESQAAVIERGEPQPVPEEITLTASFASSMAIFEKNPFNYYGRYQLTVREDSTPEDIAGFLPDTIPIKVDLQQGRNFIAGCIVDCPIKWKSLSLPKLTSGESVTIPNAAEEIVIPDGTLLNTPIGVFCSDEPLALEQNMLSDEIRLVLNVIPKDGNPTGVLARENAGLEAAFNLKPTGATAIHAYIFSEQEPEWKKLPDLPLIDAVNAQPSTANSGYTLVMRNDWEPYQSYLAEETAGNIPTPFLVGLKIEGGVYNGRQLVLAWPDTYELPPHLPDVGGAGGNENNAGSDNKNDSTEEGQRPNLPKNPEEKKELQTADSSQTPQEQQNFPSDPPQTNNRKHVSSQPSSAVQETSSKQHEEIYSDVDSVIDTPADNHTEMALLTNLPMELMSSANQEGIHKQNTGISRYGLLLAVTAAAVCITAVTARRTMKKRKV